MSNGNKRWKATVTDQTTGIKNEIGTIQVPASWGGLRERTITFTEYFYGTISSCENIPYTAAKFTNFVANNFQVDVNSSSHTNNYESGQACGSVSKVSDITGGTLHEIGNKSTTPSPPPPATTDTSPPVVSIYEPTSDSTLPAGPVRINAAATDVSGVTYMEVKINNTLLAKSSTGSIQTTWQATGPTQKRSKSKKYTLKVIAKDKFGNTGQKYYTVYITR